MDKLFIHNIAWGDLYRKMLFDYCIPSMLDDYRRLKEAGVTVKWIVHLDQMGDKREYAGVDIEYRAISGSPTSFEDTKALLKQTADEDCWIALVAPDNIQARGCLYNAYMIARNKNTGIAIAHPRVMAQKFMDTFPAGRTYSSRELVSIAMRPELMHGTLANCFDDKDANCTNHGVSIRRLENNMFAVIHTLPSPVILHPNQEDARDFYGMGYGNIDRGMNRKLFAQQRIKLVGCSDVCFFVEMTRPEMNMPPLTAGLTNNDRHCEPEQNIWNNVAVIWIGEQT